MPTPTIDPVVYEAAYAAIEQFRINEEIIWTIIGAALFFIMWMFKGDRQ